MRIAICLSGLMRTYDLCVKSLLSNIADPNNCDIFISTYDVIGHRKHNHSESDEFQAPLDVQKVRDAYGPRLRELVVHNFKEIQKTLPLYFYPGMVSMYWQVHQANELRKRYETEKGVTYDVVIRARPDALFHTGFQLTEGPWLKDALLVRYFTATTMDDQFAFGEPWVMDWYSDLYVHLGEHHAVKDIFPPDTPGGTTYSWPEQVLLRHIKQKNIKSAPFPVYFDLHRGGHSYE